MALINPETGSEVDIEPDGDYTVTFSMTLPTPPADNDDN